MANTNCLAGMACPACGSQGPFDITGVSTFVMHDDGSESHSDIEFDDRSHCVCRVCGRTGTVGAFTLQNPTPGVRAMVDASTGHLSEWDKALLSERSNQERHDRFPRVTSHEYGWILFVTGDEEGQVAELTEAQRLGASPGLLALIAHAQRAGAYILNLDADADPIPSCPLD